MRTFDSFTFEEVEEMFGIKDVENLALLTEWISSPYTGDVMQTHNLQRIRNRLFKYILNWNEDELKMFFIGPMIDLVEMETADFKPYTQRNVAATIQTIEVTGRVDFMIAKGRRTAKPPYFCIHEYTCTEPSRSEQEVEDKGDPLGQLLIAMLAAQTLNENKFPILGAYIVGRNWFFVVLDNNQYAISPEYDASSEDIFQIFAILQKSKEIIQRHI